jgi:hypothetical protein
VLDLPDITTHLTTSTAAFEPTLKNWLSRSSPPIEAMTLVRERAIRLLASGTKAAMLEEATMVRLVVEDTRFRWQCSQVLYGQLDALASILGDAAQHRSFAVPLLLRDHGQEVAALVEMLSVNGAMSLAAIKREFGTEDVRFITKMHEAGLLIHTTGDKIELTAEGDRLSLG